VATAHAHLHGAERGLRGLAPHAHSRRIFVEPLLHRLQRIPVLPARDAALWACLPRRLSVQLRQALV